MRQITQQDVYGSFADKLESYAAQRQQVKKMLPGERPVSVLFANKEQEVLASKSFGVGQLRFFALSPGSNFKFVCFGSFEET